MLFAQLMSDFLSRPGEMRASRLGRSGKTRRISTVGCTETRFVTT